MFQLMLERITRMLAPSFRPMKSFPRRQIEGDLGQGARVPWDAVPENRQVYAGQSPATGFAGELPIGQVGRFEERLRSARDHDRWSRVTPSIRAPMLVSPPTALGALLA